MLYLVPTGPRSPLGPLGPPPPGSPGPPKMSMEKLQTYKVLLLAVRQYGM